MGHPPTIYKCHSQQHFYWLLGKVSFHHDFTLDRILAPNSLFIKVGPLIPNPPLIPSPRNILMVHPYPLIYVLNLGIEDKSIKTWAKTHSIDPSKEIKHNEKKLKQN